ncbi:hypothetical protein [Agarivorans gilvus]|uniref:hypothetical protein n=1 Tax=Agarivorans gilvus TaxID=680279 RepID=UPI0012EDB67C|nr:hypothetical protein [Agarivorans gilvus]
MNVVVADDYLNSALRLAIKDKSDVELALAKNHNGYWFIASIKRIDSNELYRAKSTFPAATAILLSSFWIILLGLAIVGAIGGVTVAFSGGGTSAGWLVFLLCVGFGCYLLGNYIKKVLNCASLFNKQRDVLGSADAEEIY